MFGGPNGEREILRKNVSRHDKSVQHRNSLGRQEDDRRRREEQELELRMRNHAVLNTVPSFLGVTDESGTTQTPSLANDPFQSTTFADGFMYDASGKPILLSAGPRETEQERLWRELENLTAYDLLYGDSAAQMDCDPKLSPPVDEDATQTNVAGVYETACVFRITSSLYIKRYQ